VNKLQTQTEQSAIFRHRWFSWWGDLLGNQSASDNTAGNQSARSTRYTILTNRVNNVLLYSSNRFLWVLSY